MKIKFVIHKNRLLKIANIFPTNLTFCSMYSNSFVSLILFISRAKEDDNRSYIDNFKLNYEEKRKIRRKQSSFLES